MDGSCCGPASRFKSEQYKNRRQICGTASVAAMEAMIHFKSFINTSDLFIIVYGRRFERWLIAGSCCGPAKYFKSEQYKNRRLIGGTASVDENGSNDRRPIVVEYTLVPGICIRKTFRTCVFLILTMKSDNFSRIFVSYCRPSH